MEGTKMIELYYNTPKSKKFLKERKAILATTYVSNPVHRGKLRKNIQGME